MKSYYPEPQESQKLIGDEAPLYWPSDNNYSDDVTFGHRTDATTMVGKPKCSFSWDRIKFSVNEKEIIRGVSGNVSGGQLVAVMGCSGAGKTTLMNLLSGRFDDSNKKLPAEFNGSVSYNDMLFDLSNAENRTLLKNVSGQVKQHDVLCSTATTREAIEFAAELRLPQHLSKEDKQNRIDEILSDLKLTTCADTIIGDEYHRGLSGGERKRVSVGIELLTDPQLLFLDEPISGLDSNTAKKLLRILKNLTKSGKQIFLTIHQPSSEIFNMFDSLLLMCHGQCVYFGAACNVVHYFKLLGYQCGNYINPGDFVLDAINDDQDFFINAWSKFEGFYNTTITTDTKGKPTNQLITIDKSSGQKLHPIDEDSTMNYQNKYPVAAFTKQLKLLFLRDVVGIYRFPSVLMQRLQGCVLTAFFLGIVYWNLPHDSRGTQEISSVISLLTTLSMFNSVANAIMIFPAYRIVYEHERSVNTYSTTAYLVAKLLWTTPLIALEAFLTSIILVNMTQIGGHIVYYYFVIFISCVAYGALGLLMSCFANNLKDALVIAPMTTPMSIFNNLSVDMNRLFVLFGWLRWINVSSYMLDLLHYIAFNNYEFEMIFTGINYGTKTGQQYLQYLGIEHIEPWFNVLMIWAITFLFWITTWLVLVRRHGI